MRTGALAVQLIRPLSYPLYRLWTTLGERLVRFLLNIVVGAAIAFLFVGPIPLSLAGLCLFIPALLLAFILDFLGHFLVGLGAFWLEDTSGLMLIYSRVTMILGGMLGDLVIRRWRNGRLLVASTAIELSVPLLYYALGQPTGEAVLFGVAMRGWLAFALLFGLACMLLYVYYGTVYSTIQDVIEPSLRATAMALYFCAMYAFGGAAGPGFKTGGNSGSSSAIVNHCTATVGEPAATRAACRACRFATPPP